LRQRHSHANLARLLLHKEANDPKMPIAEARRPYREQDKRDRIESAGRCVNLPSAWFIPSIPPAPSDRRLRLPNNHLRNRLWIDGALNDNVRGIGSSRQPSFFQGR